MPLSNLAKVPERKDVAISTDGTTGYFCVEAKVEEKENALIVEVIWKGREMRGFLLRENEINHWAAQKRKVRKHTPKITWLKKFKTKNKRTARETAVQGAARKTKTLISGEQKYRTSQGRHPLKQLKKSVNQEAAQQTETLRTSQKYLTRRDSSQLMRKTETQGTAQQAETHSGVAQIHETPKDGSSLVKFKKAEAQGTVQKIEKQRTAQQSKTYSCSAQKYLAPNYTSQLKRLKKTDNKGTTLKIKTHHRPAQMHRTAQSSSSQSKRLLKKAKMQGVAQKTNKPQSFREKFPQCFVDETNIIIPRLRREKRDGVNCFSSGKQRKYIEPQSEACSEKTKCYSDMENSTLDYAEPPLSLESELQCSSQSTNSSSNFTFSCEDNYYSDDLEYLDD